MQERLLIIEEDISNSTLLQKHFEVAYDTIVYNNGLQGLVKAIDWKPRVVIINHSLQQVNSLEVCKQIREYCNAVILIIGERIEDCEIIKYYESGADDFILLPYNLSILEHKIKIFLTYSNGKNRLEHEKVTVLRYGSIIMDKISHKVFCHDTEIIFTKKEFSLLWLLIQKREEVVTKQEILKIVWSYDSFEDDRMIDTHLNRVRKKLKQCDSDVYIKTLWGIGYKIIMEENT